MRKKTVKKLLMMAGVAMVGLGGLKVSSDAIDAKEAITNIEMANDVLDEIQEQLESDSLNPEERHELILTRKAIQQEILECAARLSPRQRAELNIPDIPTDKKVPHQDKGDDVYVIEGGDNIDMRPVILDNKNHR